MSSLKELSLLVQQGENVEAVECATDLLEKSVTVEEIIEAVSEGLTILRNKCTVENFQLLDVLLASRAMVEVVDECIARKLQNEMDRLADEFEEKGKQKKNRTLVIGTIQGDVHDLGKHIIATLCRFNNFNVIDLGKDVPVDNFVKAAIAENAEFIGVSSLMTVCLPRISQIKKSLLEKGASHIKVIGGGSAVQQSRAESLNLDFLAFDAFEGLDFMNLSMPEKDWNH
ncbi:MAG: cobalamin-dependent protein [Nitrospinota bacterium]|nr:cobalamin-dependent protein [Nitrospinota bacterium]